MSELEEIEKLLDTLDGLIKQGLAPIYLRPQSVKARKALIDLAWKDVHPVFPRRWSNDQNGY